VMGSLLLNVRVYVGIIDELGRKYVMTETRMGQLGAILIVKDRLPDGHAQEVMLHQEAHANFHLLTVKSPR